MIEYGSTRTVLLTRRWAFKVAPVTKGWTAFLRGLISNCNEIRLSKLKIPELVPVCFSLPLGLLVVMPRANTDGENFQDWIIASSVSEYAEILSVTISMTEKSIGRHNGQVKAFDYGSLIKGANEEKYFRKLKL